MTYWEKRGAQLEQLADKRTRITAQKVAHLYDEALERIEAKIQKIYTTFTGSSHITEAEATRLMSAQQTKEARKELEALLERTTDQTLRQEIVTQLNAPAYGYRIAALEALRDQVYFEAKAIGNDSATYTESRLKDLYDLGYYRTAFDLSQYEGVNVPFSQLSGGRVEAAINAFWTPDVDTLAGNYSTRIWADATQLAENVRGIVTRGLMTGGNYADMAAELAAQMGDVQYQKRVNADGSTRTVATGSGAKYRATRLIRTEGNYITGQAKLQSMRDAGYEKYEFICLLETRTCSVCGGLDGKQFPVAEAQPGVNMNPMHPNCRCFVSPVLSKRLMEAGTRGAQVDASGRKETVPASMTYQEWHEKYVKGNGEMLTAQKMLQNKASDQRQFADYRQVLGEDAPKTFAEFQDLKYNNSEGWEDLKYYYRHSGEKPLAYIKIDRETQKAGITGKGYAYPVEDVDITGWTGHSENRLAQSGLTKDDALQFKQSALAMMKRYPEPETQYNYYSEDGVLGIKASTGVVNTVIGKDRFDNNTPRILEAMKKWLK